MDTDQGKSSVKLLAEQTADRIIAFIIEQEMTRDDKLPNEYDLAKQLSVSRNTLREAIRSLVARNILEIRRGDGTYIAERCGQVDDPFGLKFIKDRHKLLLDLLELRFMIEPELASMAALNATPEEDGRIHKLCREIEISILRKEPYEQLDMQFHIMIARMSHNMFAENLISVINQSPMKFLSETRTELEKDIIETHRDIVDAIRRRNPDEAHDAMYLHLLYTRKAIKKLETK